MKPFLISCHSRQWIILLLLKFGGRERGFCERIYFGQPRGLTLLLNIFVQPRVRLASFAVCVRRCHALGYRE